MSFALNLLGAMVGGALEYVSLLTGYRMLLLPESSGVPILTP